jgi:hypothetical protein
VSGACVDCTPEFTFASNSPECALASGTAQGSCNAGACSGSVSLTNDIICAGGVGQGGATLVIPPGVTEMTAEVSGGGGGSNSLTEGERNNAPIVTATLPVVPGSMLELVAGASGIPALQGAGNAVSGTGGGGSSVAGPGIALSAGGGGGAGGTNTMGGRSAQCLGVSLGSPGGNGGNGTDAGVGANGVSTGDVVPGGGGGAGGGGAGGGCGCGDAGVPPECCDCTAGSGGNGYSVAIGATNVVVEQGGRQGYVSLTW